MGLICIATYTAVDEMTNFSTQSCDHHKILITPLPLLLKGFLSVSFLFKQKELNTVFLTDTIWTMRTEKASNKHLCTVHTVQHHHWITVNEFCSIVITV